ncbi:MAG TPA: M48 family metalloprotease, partial [Terriglobales bacterium]|nr:M48 family metalloprotease [Terriglobales bacterium]
MPNVFLTASLAQVHEPFLDRPDVPPNFKVDVETGVRLRSRFFAQSSPPTGRYAIGGVVFTRLIKQLPSSDTRFPWELRIIDDKQLNAYASPEGTIYIESGLAQLAGQNSGLWAAVLSHEIAHVVRRDWARRYLYQKSLERDSTPAIVLGDPGLPSASWSDSQRA